MGFRSIRYGSLMNEVLILVVAGCGADLAIRAFNVLPCFLSFNDSADEPYYGKHIIMLLWSV